MNLRRCARVLPLPVLGAIFALGIGACSGDVQSEMEVGALENAPAALPPAPRSPDAMPDFVLQDLDGQTVRLSDFAGKAVLINFWATWCPPCRAEIPDLVELQRGYGGEDFTIIGISLDQTGVAGVRSFAQQFGLNYPVIMGNQEVVQMYGNFRGIPASFLLNADHEEVARYIGQITRDQLVRQLEPVLAEPVAEPAQAEG